MHQDCSTQTAGITSEPTSHPDHCRHRCRARCDRLVSHPCCRRTHCANVAWQRRRRGAGDDGTGPGRGLCDPPADHRHHRIARDRGGEIPPRKPGDGTARQGRPACQERRRAVHARRPGGQGCDLAGSGAARKGPGIGGPDRARSGALPALVRDERDLASAIGSGDGRPQDRARRRRGRQGAGPRRQPATRLHQDRSADRRPPWHRPRLARQPRQRQRSDRSRDHHAGPADPHCLHAARARPRRASQGLHHQAARGGARLRAGRQRCAGNRRTRLHRQPGRFIVWHNRRQGEIRQRKVRALAGNVRRRRDRSRGPAEDRDDPDRGDPKRPERAVCLRRHAGQKGRDAQGRAGRRRG